MADYIVRGTAAGDQIRFFAALTTDTVEYARSQHETSPVCTAALGRLLTAGAMMGSMMKSEEDLLTLKIECQGPIKGLLVTADAFGHVKGYVQNPDVDLPPKGPGKLDVGAALDLGVLSVIRDTGLKEPYIGQTILQTSEIAEDLTYYFATSEQTPSSVALGVLVNPNGTVRAAGGFIIQLLPDCSDAAIDKLEERLNSITSVSHMLDAGMTPEGIMTALFEGMEPEFMETMPVAFTCDCSREKTDAMVRSLPKEELQSMIDEGKPIEVVCHFCNTVYTFTVDELEEMKKEK